MFNRIKSVASIIAPITKAIDDLNKTQQAKFEEAVELRNRASQADHEWMAAKKYADKLSALLSDD